MGVFTLQGLYQHVVRVSMFLFIFAYEKEGLLLSPHSDNHIMMSLW